MPKLAGGGHKAAVTSLVAFVALAVPAPGFAAEEPLLSFSPAPVSFAKTSAGAESQAQVVDVENIAAVSVSVDSFAIEGGDASEFKLNSSGCGWLEPGQHCSLGVTFAPGSVGTKAATLAVKLKEAPERMLALTGEAVPALLSFNPSGYDFGIQRVNRGEGSFSFQLSNAGEAATQVGWLGIGGPATGNFWIDGTDCWNGRWLAPGESCNALVRFNPWETIAYAAELQAHVNGATFGAALAGYGGRGLTEASANPFEFGSVPVGSVGPVKEIVLTNNGNLPGSFFIAVIAGGSVGSFQLLDEDCTAAPLAPGASCTALVRFAPQGSGPKSARLALFGDDDGGTMVMLSGEGLPAAPLAAAPAPAAGSSAAVSATLAQAGKHRRFVRGKKLFAGRARCHAVKCRKALRARRIVAGD